MQSEMTLTLKLAGVANLISAIRALNRAITSLNNNLGASANALNAAATKINQAAQNLKNNRIRPSRAGIPGQGGGGGGGGGGNRPPTNPINQPGTYNAISSAISALLGSRLSKLLTPLVQMAAVKFMPMQPKGFMGPVSPAAYAAWLANITKMVNMLKLGAIALGLFVIGIKLTADALVAFADNLEKRVSTFWKAGGGEQAAQQASNIGRQLNIDPDEVASDASKFPGYMHEFIAKLRYLSTIKDDQNRARAARAMGIDEKYLPLTKHPKDLERALRGNSGLYGGGVQESSYQMNQAIGSMKGTLDNLLTTLSPLATAIVMMVSVQFKILSVLPMLLNPLVIISKMLLNIGNFINDKFGGAGDKLNDAANKFAEAVGQFTKKTGTIGGGERAANAIPRAYTWYAHQQQLIQDAERMGAFQF